MISKSVRETSKISKIFLDKILKTKGLEAAMVVGLSGDLGAGKTAFTQSVGKHLKIKNKIISPTFVIMKKYPLPLPRGSARRARGSNFKYFFHLDAYRLKDEKELLHLGWDEIVGDKEHLVFIEWPENVIKAMPKHSRYINISLDKKGRRKLELK